MDRGKTLYCNAFEHLMKLKTALDFYVFRKHLRRSFHAFGCKKGDVYEMRRGYIKAGQINTTIPSKKITFKELGEEYLRNAEVRGLSEYTIKSYRHQIKYILEYAGEELSCKDINLGFMENYIRYLKETKGISNPVTINSYLQNTSPIIKYGMKKRYIMEQFVMPFVRGQETIKEIYSPDELNTLLEKPKKQDFVSIRTNAIIWVLASTGIRARELRELQIKNVDLLNMCITVNKTKNKKPRVLPISKSLYKVLAEYAEVRNGDAEDYLFPTIYNEKLAMSTLQDSVKTYCNGRGIYKTSLHLFRHTFITNAVNRNVSPLVLQRITGHSTLQQLNRYYNAKIIDLVDVVDSIAPKNERKQQQFK